MKIEELDSLLDTLKCPCCQSELEDKWSPTMNVSWLECAKCDFDYVYERG
jgi:hypothetical protein